MSEEEPDGSIRQKNPKSRWSYIAERTLINKDEEKQSLGGSATQSSTIDRRRYSQKLLDDIKQSKSSLFQCVFVSIMLPTLLVRIFYLKKNKN